jgi:hypothetical protein
VFFFNYIVKSSIKLYVYEEVPATHSNFWDSVFSGIITLTITRIEQGSATILG